MLGESSDMEVHLIPSYYAYKSQIGDRMILWDVNIQKIIAGLFDISKTQLKEKIINVFIPLGGISGLPAQQF